MHKILLVVAFYMTCISLVSEGGHDDPVIIVMIIDNVSLSKWLQTPGNK